MGGDDLMDVKLSGGYFVSDSDDKLM